MNDPSQKPNLRLATLNGCKLPSQFRLDNPQYKSHSALAFAYMMHGSQTDSPDTTER